MTKSTNAFFALCKGLVVILLSLCPMHCVAELQSAAKIETVGGTMTWTFNPGALAPLGIRLGTEITSTNGAAHSGRYEVLVTHAARSGGLTIAAHADHIDGIEGGIVELHDGPRFKTPTGEVNLALARLRVSTPLTFALSVTDRAGRLWASLDHPHYGLSDDGKTFWMDHFDLRMGPAFASALGDPSLTGIVIGSARLDLPIARRYEQTILAEGPKCSVNWPSAAATVDLRVILLDHDPELGGLADSVTVMRCGIPVKSGGYVDCTATSTDGLVVLAPDVAVRNGGSASIAWRQMFMPPGPPYANDQHPYLIWNLYRIDADGTFRQLGRSGVKHAYYADNFSCPCTAQLASYPGCHETYAAGTNDMADTLGPRSEIIPATGQWGRCGSVFDSACKGSLEAHYIDTDDGYRNRLAVPERELLPALHPGARYLLEYGYIVRDQVEPEHALAHRWILPAKTKATNGIRWSVTPMGFDPGPAINAWVDPEHPAPGAITRQLKTGEGHLRVAARTTKLPNGKYLYQYSVMNENFSHSITEGREPNLRIVTSTGIDRLVVKLANRNGTTIDLPPFGTGKGEIEPWKAIIEDANLVWRAPPHHTLDWGNVLSFAFTSPAVPSLGNILVESNEQGALSQEIESLVPSGGEAKR